MQRGAEITLVNERPADNPAFHGPATAFTHLPARRLRWPANRRPGAASLHAKVLVIDRTVALVGSANVTSSAVARNLECGLLVRDAVVAGDIAQHVDDLVGSASSLLSPIQDDALTVRLLVVPLTSVSRSFPTHPLPWRAGLIRSRANSTARRRDSGAWGAGTSDPS
ncbi:MAG: phospholipase D-like domain-containing protein [Pseudonocardiaceae bacterium]